MLHRKYLFWCILVVAIVIGVACYVAMKSENRSGARFVVDADELPSAEGERVIWYVSDDGTLSSNPSESVGTVELWLE